MTSFPENEFEKTVVISAKDLAAAAMPEAVGHYIVVTADGVPPKRVELGSEPLTIGRDAKRDLTLTDTEVSRFHAQLTLAGGKVTVEDKGSTNGTFLDGKRITGSAVLQDGSVVRIGSHQLTYQRRSRKDVERSNELDRDLQKASKYVFSLLPAPITAGPVQTEWLFVPSTQLGGDAFGYDWLDDDSFVFYLLDVSGHGVGSAMHSVTVLNVMRQRALPDVDFRNPAAVLASLNGRFQMDDHNGMFFTIWYGVYRPSTRTLTYGSAGHHQAYLVPADRTATQPLGAPALMIGAMPGLEFEVHEATIPAGSSLHLFSDGAYEVVTTTGERWNLSDYEQLLLQPPVEGMLESKRQYQEVRKATGPGPLDDDLSLLILTFP